VKPKLNCYFQCLNDHFARKSTDEPEVSHHWDGFVQPVYRRDQLAVVRLARRIGFLPGRFGKYLTNDMTTEYSAKYYTVSRQSLSTKVKSASSYGLSMEPGITLFGVPPLRKKDLEELLDHTLGHSRRFFLMNIRLRCDGHGHLLHFALTVGQSHESMVLDRLLENTNSSRLDREGNLTAWPVSLGGDDRYRADSIDEEVWDLGHLAIHLLVE